MHSASGWKICCTNEQKVINTFSYYFGDFVPPKFTNFINIRKIVKLAIFGDFKITKMPKRT